MIKEAEVRLEPKETNLDILINELQRNKLIYLLPYFDENYRLYK